MVREEVPAHAEGLKNVARGFGGAHTSLSVIADLRNVEAYLRSKAGVVVSCVGRRHVSEENHLCGWYPVMAVAFILAPSTYLLLVAEGPGGFQDIAHSQCLR